MKLIKLQNKIRFLLKCDYFRSRVATLAILILMVMMVPGVTLAQAGSGMQQDMADNSVDRDTAHNLGASNWEDELELIEVQGLSMHLDYKKATLTYSGYYIFSDNEENFGIEFSETFNENGDIECGADGAVTDGAISYTMSNRSFNFEWTNDWTKCGCDPELDPTYCQEKGESSYPDPNFERSGELTEEGKKLVREYFEPSCDVPASGDWEVAEDCWLHENRQAPANVTVLAGVTMTISDGSNLDIDFKNHNLRIKPTGKLIVKPGSKIS